MQPHNLTQPYENQPAAWQRVQDTYDQTFEQRTQNGHTYVVLPAAGDPA